VTAKLTNSVVNPFIYAITTAQFSQSLRAIINRIVGSAKPLVGSSTRSSGLQSSSKR
jgi:hypothetical protein